MDDQLAIAAYKHNDKQSLKTAKLLTKKLANCYDKTMIMEIKPEDTNSNLEENELTNHRGKVHFLEAYVHFEKDNIYISHANKNETTLIKQHPTQKFLRYHHETSYAPQSLKRGTIIETLIRTQRYSHSHHQLKESIKLIKIELELLGYKNNFLKNIIRHLKRTRPTEWNQIEF